jgi:hypothetical protein
MISTREQFMHLMKEKGTLSLEEIANTLEKNSDYILGLSEGDNSYFNFLVDEKKIISLKGIGSERCFFCGDESVKFDKYNQSTMGILLSDIPKELILGMKQNYEIIPNDVSFKGVRGHKKCYNSIDLFFRLKKEDDPIKKLNDTEEIVCWDCSSWYGGWVDASEVEEKCSQKYIKEEQAGHQGCIGSRYACNFFSPCNDMKTHPEFERKRELWEKIKEETDKRTLQGYKNFVQLLKDKYWLIPDSI